MHIKQNPATDSDWALLTSLGHFISTHHNASICMAQRLALAAYSLPDPAMILMLLSGVLPS